MTRILVYFALGYLFMLLQAVLLPRLIPYHYTPDLVLILIVYLGLNEDYLRGCLLAYLLGNLQDVFAGTHLGMYGMAMLATYLVVRNLVDRFNAESRLLLLFMVLVGTAVEGGVLVGLGMLADSGELWLEILGRLLPQALLNLAAAAVLLRSATWLQRRLAPRRGFPGLKRLDNRYGS